jgi:hypothetical protein
VGPRCRSRRPGRNAGFTRVRRSICRTSSAGWRARPGARLVINEARA